MEDQSWLVIYIVFIYTVKVLLIIVVRDVGILKMACDQLQVPIANFLKTSSPYWIIYDFNFYWLGSLAAQHGIRSAYYSIFPNVMLGFIGSLEVIRRYENLLAVEENVSDAFRFGATVASSMNDEIIFFSNQSILSKNQQNVDGSFTPESVADSLSLVMVSEEGKVV
ncbi:hypothetical protein QVD17_05149 [Tagetes erecta]|uniref:Uncharacterized protein n=1 Tax=Tagetes erecta TaxID=13708 RepID=A0AAD8LDW4_TARER|nr:hypothetical protein QVD17_05149 [Tagetes erecta]